MFNELRQDRYSKEAAAAAVQQQKAHEEHIKAQAAEQKMLQVVQQSHELIQRLPQLTQFVAHVLQQYCEAVYGEPSRYRVNHTWLYADLVGRMLLPATGNPKARSVDLRSVSSVPDSVYHQLTTMLYEGRHGGLDRQLLRRPGLLQFHPKHGSEYELVLDALEYSVYRHEHYEHDGEFGFREKLYLVITLKGKEISVGIRSYTQNFPNGGTSFQVSVEKLSDLEAKIVVAEQWLRQTYPELARK